MRSRGWAGTTPASDDEAISRILTAVDEEIAEHGAGIRLADVARRLGVTRQTVYRYFPNADALLIASAMRAVNGFIDQVVDHARGLNDPVTAVIECVSFGVERLSGDPQLENLLARGDDGEAVASLTSDTAIAFCLSVFHHLDVDWKLHGFDDPALRELAEMTLRTVQSLLTDPGSVPREGLALRRFVARWLGPAILYPRWTSLSIQERVSDDVDQVKQGGQ
ncbi:Transcriptional regulator, TetR family [Mycolicibacterium fortuitum]|uniref:Transcriptional regulator, TetR family n=1 Tax=Mycolicibacterium fortuitum TaxID=1766 RepID=A0A0N9XP27_MYCFO|nr:TetR/AcrR family transcriptional regulator [Mycolicibacterium fortuitum]ALI28694.1 Transcriptional regulator, TetR family [Mycolicibacterium fortuitum]MDG5768477.1 TetR/AcrR family transcriptional regulator [Mycolicibacterium fortuitum]MDG5785167.1 TetR/AcrR family transcriptional regulator [Mycolicibacterium fortuitum]OBB01100.1 TetR family transcriptional regulator [Mycolicibacterium fortuitum]OBB33928.1 TetR family transcriptional regulator [Mycolicibacterium fortuitum]